MKMSLRIAKSITHYNQRTYGEIKGKRTIYFLRDTTLVNGRPSWHSTYSTNDYDLEHQSNAIWFDIKYNYWVFGPSKASGTSGGFVHTTQDAICPSQKDMIFKYVKKGNNYFNNDFLASLYGNYGNKKWKIAKSDLVSLDCLKYY